MDAVKEAFARIKEDMSILKEEILSIRRELSEMKEPQIQTIQTQNPTQIVPPTDNPTDIQTQEQPSEALKPSNLNTSIGNGGVPTNRQTNQQTIQQTDIPLANTSNPILANSLDEFHKAKEVLESLDTMKKALRLKFKRLTPQEMLIFSTLYSLEEMHMEEISYKLIANNLNLSESSIRDYINKLTKKGIPIIKRRLNNKQIVLSISEDLKKVANLSTIMTLRDL